MTETEFDFDWRLVPEMVVLPWHIVPTQLSGGWVLTEWLRDNAEGDYQMTNDGICFEEFSDATAFRFVVSDLEKENTDG
jgi:hypothetical protein